MNEQERSSDGRSSPHRWRRYPKYKPSGLKWMGEVPEGWEVLYLGRLSQLVVPMRDKPPEFDGDIPWIRIEDFDGKYISDSKTNQRVSLETVNKMNLKIYPVGTVLCSCSCRMGSTAIVVNPLISNQTFIGIIPKNDLNSIFLYYLMSASSQELQAIGKGAIQQYLSREEFSHLKLAFPPLPEQHAIATFLDRETARIDALIAKKERQIELLQEKRSALISNAVTKGLDPNAKMKDSGVEWLGMVPGGWKVKKLKHFAEIRGRIGWRTLTTEDYVDEGPILLGVRNILQNNQLSLDDLTHIPIGKYEESPEIMVQENDILLAKTGATIGKSCVVPRNDCKLTINAAVNILRPKEGILPQFLNYLVSSNSLQHQMLSNIAFNARGNLFQDNIANIFGILPSLLEQHAIAAFLDRETTRIDYIIEKINDSIEKLNEYRSALISAAVTGKIDVRRGIPA